MKPLALLCILAALLLAGLTVGGRGAAHSMAPLLDTASPTATGNAPVDTATATGTAVATTIPPTGAAETSTSTATPTDRPTAGPTNNPTVTNTPTATATRPPACGLPAWHEAPVPNGNEISDLVAFTPDNVWAAGSGIYHWDGTNWHLSLAPYSTEYGYFTYLVARTPYSIWGFDYNGYTDEHWDGNQWRALPQYAMRSAKRPAGEIFYYPAAAAVGPDDAFLAINIFETCCGSFSDVLHCSTKRVCGEFVGLPPSLHALGGVAPDDLWVFGDSGISHITTGTVTLVPAPNIGLMSGVAAIARNDVWAVGGGGFLHWDGVAWTHVPSPAGGEAISARSGNDVWAAGSVVQHWDGTNWQIVPGQRSTSINHISALGPADVWTAGYTAAGRRVIDHYAALPTFSDVPAGDVFAPAVEWLACQGILSGYTCGGVGEPCDGYNRPYVRPSSGIGRGQLLKLVTRAAGWTAVAPATATFADVPVGSPFYSAIETGAAHELVGGYACGSTPSEPCDAARRPYFRPGNAMSRGQLAQVLTVARGYPVPTPAQGTFADVAATDVFSGPIAAVAAQGIVSGYACGSVPSEPCDAARRPYYRPAAGATRGQVSKVVSRAYGGP